MNGIFVKRHAAANTIDCHVSAIFICSADSNSIEESIEDGIHTIRGYYTSPNLKIFPFYQTGKLIRYFSLWKKALLLYKTKHGKPDLVNSNIVYPVSIIATGLKFFWKVPYIITEHWTGYFPEDGRYNGFAKKIIAKIAVAHAEAVVTVSHKLSSRMNELGLKNNYFVIPNVVDPEVFKLKAEAKEDSFNFTHISSLDNAQKNITGIIRAFKKFQIAYPLSILTIIGDIDTREFREETKNLLNDARGINLLRSKEGTELAKFLQKADAFLLFSNYENLPVVMLESFMCGIPVIATRVGDIPEYINTKNGMLVDSNNEEQLLQAMKEIYSHRANYNPIEIRNMVLNKVSPIAISRQFTDIYRRVLKNKF
jgi:glycosyltransferase involved in cell wall biosynthesis